MKRKSNPLVSILLPCVDNSPSVGAAIQCGIMQTYPNVEVVVIAPDQETFPKYVELYQGRSSKLSIIPPPDNPDRLFNVAGNRAIDCAKGDFLLMTGPDDMLPVDYVARLIAQASAEGASTATTHYTAVDFTKIVRMAPITEKTVNLAAYGKLLVSLHLLAHRSLEPGFFSGLATNTVREGTIIAKVGTVPIISGTRYVERIRPPKSPDPDSESVAAPISFAELCRLAKYRSDTTDTHGAAAERTIQAAYADLCNQIEHRPTELGVHGLGMTDREALADVIRFRAYVRGRFWSTGGEDYHRYLARRESALWFKFKTRKKPATASNSLDMYGGFTTLEQYGGCAERCVRDNKGSCEVCTDCTDPAISRPKHDISEIAAVAVT